MLDKYKRYASKSKSSKNDIECDNSKVIERTYDKYKRETVGRGAKGEQGPQGKIGPQGPRGEKGNSTVQNNAYLVQSESVSISPTSRFVFNSSFINGTDISVKNDGMTVVLSPNATYYIKYTVTGNSYNTYIVGLRVNEALIKGSLAYCEEGIKNSISNGAIYTTGNCEEELDLYNFSNRNIKTIPNSVNMQIIRIN